MRSLTGLMVLFLMLALGCGEDDKSSDDTGAETDTDTDTDADTDGDADADADADGDDTGKADADADADADGDDTGIDDSPGPWEGMAACSNIRVLASNGVEGIAMNFWDLEAVVYDALISGEPIEVTGALSTPDGTIALYLGEAEAGGSICSSGEEFPYVEDGSAAWVARAGTVRMRFEPDHAWPDEEDWESPGPELGTVTVWGEDISFEPWNEVTGDRTIAEFEISARLSGVNLPA